MIATAQAISPRLVQEYRGVAVESADLERARGQRRAHRLRRGTEQDQSAVLQNQRDAERDDELAEMAFIQAAGGAQAGYAADQELVQQRAAGEHDRAGAERADEGAGIRAEERQHAAAR